jgi:hypothetical protein
MTTVLDRFRLDDKVAIVMNRSSVRALVRHGLPNRAAMLRANSGVSSALCAAAFCCIESRTVSTLTPAAPSNSSRSSVVCAMTRSVKVTPPPSVVRVGEREQPLGEIDPFEVERDRGRAVAVDQERAAHERSVRGPSVRTSSAVDVRRA